MAFDVAETLMKLKFAFQAEGHNPDTYEGQKEGICFFKKKKKEIDPIGEIGWDIISVHLSAVHVWLIGIRMQLNILSNTIVHY